MYWKLLLVLWLWMLEAVSPAKIHGNPANDLVELINANRTAGKLPKLYNSAGLGCMALQYISECKGNCSSNNTISCEPPETDITEVYAANCGVELPTVDVISGHLIGCHWKHSDPEDAFEAVVASGKKALSVIHGKEHTQVGAGFDRGHRHGPFFWCLLFSSGGSNSTFVLEGGKGIVQRAGCFSGSLLSCSSAADIRLLHSLVAPSPAALLLLLFVCRLLLL